MRNANHEIYDCWRCRQHSISAHRFEPIGNWQRAAEVVPLVAINYHGATHIIDDGAQIAR